SLDVAGWRLLASPAERQGLTGIHVEVVVAGPAPDAHRPLSDILRRIDASALPARARGRARAVFEALGRVEGRIHGVPFEAVEFHELGAVDSIVDVCGAVLALELLEDPEVYCAPLPLGSGTVRTAHGVLPVPSPATLELSEGLPVRFEGAGELTTPTGAALVRVLARVSPPPELVVERVGYGVGTRVLEDRPNVLRATLGRIPRAAAGTIYVVETNLDDCSPQLLGTLVESLLSHGALDAWVVPATMKKGRPGHLLGMLVEAERRSDLVDLILRESTSLGVRTFAVERTALARHHVTVETPHGPVRIKVGTLGDEALNAAPEYEDVRARAEAAGVPVKQVWAEALAAWSRRGRGS
ncbi:MAG TPA: nickel pincer cofactor biosynthesis protein LarC, partial [Myxococcaceae bacterium]|nr:nickel pincer cofactor biosynthesis protein LarC [Myxococcaceae bacterium]